MAVATIDFLLHQAYRERVSDIHLEPREQGMLVRFRIDGCLYDYHMIDPSIMQAVVARLKILSHLNIAEQRIPQDGKFFVEIGSKTFDIRVATFPTMYGEKVVMRLLDRQHHILSLAELGCSPEIQHLLQKTLTRDGGFFLVTGPTGSGKTTTLYALLNELNHDHSNIVTLEDPIEYVLPTITQGPVNYEIGFTFERGLRALLRQDPDVILVGEIRDKETARVALQAALTGHKVLSTLHTHDAPSGLVRLLDMEIEPFLIACAVTGIIAQRLVRKLCPSCKYTISPSAALQEFAQEHDLFLEIIWDAPGCEQCAFRGIQGRVGVFEVLLITDPLKELIHAAASLRQIYHEAQASGFTSFMQDALYKLVSGDISEKEFWRIRI